VAVALLGPAAGQNLESLGGSSSMQEIAQQVRLLAGSERTTVLLEGEVGSGKGWVAQLIHALSARSRQPFAAVSCAGTTSQLLEVELFGQEKAATRRSGSRASSRLPTRERCTLARSRTCRRNCSPSCSGAGNALVPPGGGTREISVDVRLIAADSTLAAEVEAGRFREDLYYRLSVMPLRLPPVRERPREDRAQLVQRMHHELGRELPEGPTSMAGEVLERFLAYPWPGNVREIRNVLERAMILGQGLPQVAIEHLPGEFRNRPGIGDRRHTPMTLEELERQHIERTLRHHNGNRTRAAHELGISRATLINKIKRYDFKM
jgi:two-component system response regulator HydG